MSDPIASIDFKEWLNLKSEVSALQVAAHGFLAYMDSDIDGGDGVFEERMERFASQFREALKLGSSLQRQGNQ